VHRGSLIFSWKTEEQAGEVREKGGEEEKTRKKRKNEGIGYHIDSSQHDFDSGLAFGLFCIA
jgi:hypothetical protein